ncbi:RWD domain-containing protein 2A isoform X1 [Athalia rosae]|uniref:RWD domain-containing protein 2A isoform X1 n=2 Tax=Athalia rosae TaxID=37344 RepID=UPI002033D1BE|nr:RWD domain-containing protein 2A isoform X1 [Athalia rosae]
MILYSTSECAITKVMNVYSQNLKLDWITLAIWSNILISLKMSMNEKTMENYQAQVTELEALQSIYPNEISIVDHGVLADMNNYVSGTATETPQLLEYVVTISHSKGNCQLYVTLPADYPTIKPEVYARSELFNRLEQSNFNKSLSHVAVSQENGQPCIYFLISWVQDNIEKYVNSSNIKKNQKTPDNLEKEINLSFSRYWIYSHHIYSKIKRKEIIEIAKENNVTGFCLAGKPGIVCIEGDSRECEDWWQRIKAMNWQKILVKYKEDESLENNNLDNHRKFSTFQEISFPSSDRHNDMGELYRYLTEHNVQYVFKELFGLEGKPASTA